MSISPQCLPPNFGSIWLTIREQMRFEDFQDGHLGDHLRYWNRTILAILKLHVDPLPPINVGFNPHYSLGDVIWRISRWRPWLAILNQHVTPMRPTKFWLNLTYHSKQMRFEDFQDGHLGGHLRYRNRTILAILNLYVAPMPPINVGFNPHYSLGDVI